MQRFYGTDILSIMNPLVINYDYSKLFIENVPTNLIMHSIPMQIKIHFNIFGPFYQKYHVIKYFSTNLIITIQLFSDKTMYIFIFCNDTIIDQRH